MQAISVRWAFMVFSCLLASLCHAQSNGAGFKVRPVGTLLVNGAIRIPAYVVAVEDAIANPGNFVAPDLSGVDMRVQKSISAEAGNSLVAYWTNVGWMLVPRGWRVARAAVGVDNSSAYEFKEPNGGTGMLAAYDSGGACVGCALDLAMPYFSDARRQAKADGFPVARGSPGHVVRLGKHTVAYNRQSSSGQVFDGIAFFNSDGDVDAFTYEVSLPPSQHALATAILNWKLPLKSQR